jgi:hypothetical protein
VRFALLVLLAGCSSSQTAAFQPTQPGYQPQPKTGDVDVFAYAPPNVPYDEVGVLTVKGGSRGEILQRATQKAKQVGCDIIVARSISISEGTEPRSAQVGPPSALIGQPPSTTIGGDERRGGGGSGQVEFICGVYRR